MIAGRLYILDNRYSSKTLKPITNSASAGVVVATRDANNVANFLFRAEAHESGNPTWWRLKHEATGLYLNSPTAADGEQLTIGTANNVMDVTGSDGAGWKIRPLAAPFSFLNVAATPENTSVTLVSNANTTNQLWDILLYTPVNVTAPVLPTRIFRHFSMIVVSGVSGGAVVRILKNGQQVAQVTDTEFDGVLEIPVSGFSAGDVIKVTQELGGVTSAESTGTTVLMLGKVRQIATSQYQAFEMRVSIAASNDIQAWTGDEGDPIGPVRDTQAQAQEDLTSANFTITTI